MSDNASKKTHRAEAGAPHKNIARATLRLVELSHEVQVERSARETIEKSQAPDFEEFLEQYDMKSTFA